MATIRPGVVSVVLVNFRGADDTIAAVGSLEQMAWDSDRLEIVVVENGSGDDSAERLGALGDRIVLVVSDENLGFAGGCNLGVARSSGEYVGFLNNDAKPDADWLAAAIPRFERSPRVGAVASRVLDWEGRLVDYIGSAMTWFGMGYKPFTGDPVPDGYTPPERVLFGTGSAMFVRRDVFDRLGGFDESYFMFFEDVDLGWRINLAGWAFVYEPGSLAFHKHHASMESYGRFKEQYLLERNALATLYKNMSDENMPSALAAALALSVRRGVALSGADSAELDLRGSADEGPEQTTPRVLLSSVYGIDRFVENLDVLRAARDAVQGSRVVSDAQLWSLFGRADVPVIHDPGFVAGYEKIVGALQVAAQPLGTRVLVITGDPLGDKLAGPAIRAWNMAAALSARNEVALLSLSGVAAGLAAPFDLAHVRPGDDRAFARWEDWADVIVFQGLAMAMFPALRTTSKIVVADVYDPMHLEQLEQSRSQGAELWTRNVESATAVLNEQLGRADFLLAASERQRHFYLGQLAALGRITPSTYDGDPDLRGLIDVVPFGLERIPPEHRAPAMKGVVPGIVADDRILLWSGGLYDWFDPLTLIEAVALVAQSHPEVKLYFQGTRHPHPGVPEMSIVSRSRERARSLGILDSQVFFNDSWVDFADRQNFLTEADAGVSTHHAHIETTFSFRTRILDYLWAGLPMVVTAGDHFAELIEREDLGRAVPAEDPVALADAITEVLFDADARERMIANVARVREDYMWDVVLEPLLRFVDEAHPARDRRAGSAPATARRRERVLRSGLRHDVGLALMYLRAGGPRVVARKVVGRLRRR